MIEKLSAFDRAIVEGLNGLVKKNSVFNWLAKALAAWPVYFIPLVLVFYWFWSPRWRTAEIRAVAAGLFAWQAANRLIQLFIERARPTDGSQVSELLFRRPTDSFPSNHAAFGMAVFFVLFLAGDRGLSWTVLALTLVFSVFRIATGLHFPSDVIAGWLVGLGSALAFHGLGGLFDHYVARPLIKFAKAVKLA